MREEKKGAGASCDEEQKQKLCRAHSRREPNAKWSGCKAVMLSLLRWSPAAPDSGIPSQDATQDASALWHTYMHSCILE